MIQADYHYSIKELAGRNVIVIEDKNLGGKSVTNDIENVVDEICNKENIFPRDYMIIYKDTDGMWDGWDYNKQDFVPIQQRELTMAVDLYIRIQLSYT